MNGRAGVGGMDPEWFADVGVLMKREVVHPAAELQLVGQVASRSALIITQGSVAVGRCRTVGVGA